MTCQCRKSSQQRVPQLQTKANTQNILNMIEHVSICKWERLVSLAGEAAWLATCVLNSSVVAAAIKVPATFWTVQDTMGASGQATSAGDKDELEPTQQCNYRSNGSNFVFKMISELPWKFQVSKGLVNFFTESNVPRLAQDIHHRLVWQRAGEAGNVLWEGRWMGQLT